MIESILSRFSSRSNGFIEDSNKMRGSLLAPNPCISAGSESVENGDEDGESGTDCRGGSDDSPFSSFGISLCFCVAPNPDAIAEIFDIASGLDRICFSFSEKSLSKIHTPLLQHFDYFFAFLLACRIDQFFRFLNRHSGDFSF